LVKEDIFPITSFGGKVLQIPILIYAMFKAELLPELAPN
jgi:hypothetical protein